MLVIPPGPEHKDLTSVQFRFRRPFQVRLLREACLVDLQACQLRTKKRGEVAHRALSGRRAQTRRSQACCDPECLVVALTMGTSALLLSSRCSRCWYAADRRGFRRCSPSSSCSRAPFFALLRFSSAGSSSACRVVLAVARVGTRLCFLALSLAPWPPGVGGGVVLALRAFIVSAVVLAKLVCGVSVDFTVFGLSAVFAAFSKLRGFRQVERFAVRSFDTCRQQFSTRRASPEFLLLFAAPDPGGC